MRISYFIILTIIVIGFTTNANFAFAESESFTVAARSYEQTTLHLDAGDEVDYSIKVRGGANDDINIIIDVPGEDIIEGLIIENYSEEFTAPTSGTYVFTFDNTISKISNKSVLFSYDIIKNSYSIYIENIPEYSKNYASNALFDAIQYWTSVFPKKNFYVADSQSDADIIIQWVKDFTGTSHVGFQYLRLVEIGLGDSICGDNWNPYSSKHVTEITTHEIGHAIGEKHSNDPNSIMYPTVSSTEYGNVSEQFNLGENQGIFIPLCLSQKPSSIQYTVETTDNASGFDVYVVPLKEDFDNLMQGESFVYYSDDDCFGEGYVTYSGECKGVIYGTGLAVIHGPDLSFSTASITVNYHETEYTGDSSQIESKFRSQIHDTATIDVNIFGDTFDFSHPYFQNKDNFIKFEDGNGQTIHKYDEYASIGYLFDSFGMSLTNDCLVFSDGRNFCNNSDYSLNFSVNGKTHSSLSQYVFNDGDRIKIIYESIPKTASPIATQTNTPSESKQTESVKSSLKTTSKIVCGKGTIEKNNVCIVDSTLEIAEKSSSKSGGCLIATATFGSELAPQVQQLRELRDNSLLQTQSGTSFMNSFNNFYYSFSPVIADYERENPVFKEMVKVAITPMISSLSILNYVEMDSESSVLGYGISLILLNIGMYVGVPASVIVGIRKKINPS